MSYFPRIARYGILAGALAIAPGFAQDQNSGTAANDDQNNSGTVTTDRNPATSPYTNGGGVNNSSGPNYNPTNPNTYNRGYDYGRPHNFGWLGLLGLAGLAGLRRRDRRVDVNIDRDRVDRTTRLDTTDRTGRI